MRNEYSKNNRGRIKVFTDGSVNMRKKRAGTGVVIVNNKTVTCLGHEIEINTKMDADKKVAHNSANFYAESFAVMTAIKSVFISDNSPVTIHTDNKNVFVMLKRIQRQSDKESGYLNVPENKNLANQLRCLLQGREKNIKFKLVNKEANNTPTQEKYMAMAHNEAVRGSGSGNFKAIPGEQTNLQALEHAVLPAQFGGKGFQCE